MKNILAFWEKYYLHSLILSGIVFFIYIFWFYSSFFYVSILNYKWISSDEFDGTVYPIEYIPNPMELSYWERKQKFEEIDSKYFIKTPLYNPSIFGKNLDNISVWTREYTDVMTQKVLYSVPYLSTYNFDYKEYSWSHPGIDMVVPEWTPVLNIANGLVVDSWFQPSWFWNYVLVKHSNIDFSGKKQNIYSLYAHLSKINVKVGTKLKKSEIIWLVWESGTATVPHLHFQIDAESAPYSPFWPFSSADMKKAWVWFFEAINIGLGKEMAMTHTLNSLKFVNDHLDFILYTGGQKESENLEVISETLKEEEKDISDEQKEQPKDTYPDHWENIELPEQIDVTQDDILTKMVKSEDILQYEVELLSAMEIDDIILNDNIDITKLETESSQMPIQNLENTSEWDEQKEAHIWEDIQDIELPSENLFFSDIQENNEYYEEIVYFKENNIISWFYDNTFRPKNNITRVEALKIILLANKIEPILNEKSQFKDILTNSWENTYVNAWVKEGIISLDNTIFSPFRNVSRVEALKLVFSLSKVEIEVGWESLDFADISTNDWYYNYVDYAVKNNLIQITGNYFEPNKAITREELVSILYKYIKI